MNDCKHRKILNILINFLVFSVPVLIMLLTEYLETGTFGSVAADGPVYLSIADNFIETGHFIQTERHYINFVVPPGVPFFLTVFRFLGFDRWMITAVHALLFGVSNILLLHTEKRLFGRGGMAVLIYTTAFFRCRLYMGTIFVEHYYMFMLCLIVWLIFADIPEKRKLLLLNFVGVTAFLTRSVLSVVYICILAYTVYVFVSGKKWSGAAAVLLLPIILMSANLCVNYRETGEIILLDSYSGTDMYKAVSPKTTLTYRDSLYFDDEVLTQIYEAPGMTMKQKCDKLVQMAREIIKEDPWRCVKNTLTRLYNMFLWAYVYATIPAIIGGLLMAAGKSKGVRLLNYTMLAVNVLLAVITSFGFPEIRYTIVIWALCPIHLSALFYFVLDKLKIRMAKNRIGV